LDVAVDVRLGSPTFGHHVAAELSEANRRQLWVPRGFAHGFVVLSETADFFYKCDDLYSPKDEIAVRWNDPAIGISWGIESPSLSVKDAAAPLLSEVKNLPIYGQV
jgi:dTDP-4-dehydrorhamnose 3,5-epimerase